MRKAITEINGYVMNTQVVYRKEIIMRLQKLIVLLTVALLVGSSYGDELILKNGDRLTGKIVHLVDGKMLFKSDVAGEVTVELANIQTLSSDEPITVNLKDNTGLNQKVVSVGAGRFGVSGSDALKAQEFAVADITSINPPLKPAPKWTGDASVGITSTRGNTKTDMISANANATKRTEKDRMTVSADYAKGEQEDPDTKETVTIEDWWRAKGKYDYFFSKKKYGYIDGRYEKDAVAELDRRMIVGVGGGYQWIESENMNFSTEFGLASLYEKFRNQTDSNSEISFQVGYNFDKQLRKNIKFTHDLTYYPAIDKFSDYYLTTTAGIRADFTEKIFMTFKAIFNYDATPAIGRGRSRPSSITMQRRPSGAAVPIRSTSWAWGIVSKDGSYEEASQNPVFLPCGDCGSDCRSCGGRRSICQQRAESSRRNRGNESPQRCRERERC